MKREDIIERLSKLGKDLNSKFGVDSYIQRCELHDIKELVNGLESQQSEPSPSVGDYFKEWGTICRMENRIKNPLIHSHKTLLEFSEQYAQKVLQRKALEELTAMGEEELKEDEPQWISVKDKQPDNHEFVLVVDKYAGITVNRDLNSSWDAVTHWMPLPQNPCSVTCVNTKKEDTSSGYLMAGEDSPHDGVVGGDGFRVEEDEPQKEQPQSIKDLLHKPTNNNTISSKPQVKEQPQSIKEAEELINEFAYNITDQAGNELIVLDKDDVIKLYASQQKGRVPVLSNEEIEAHSEKYYSCDQNEQNDFDNGAKWYRDNHTTGE